ncbi:MAG: DHH family phosphoesterase, partial [Bellilinea sp.]
MNDEIHAAIREKLKKARLILIASHVRPDGDAIGSLLGLGLSLQAVGKHVQMVLRDGVPDNLSHLPGSSQIVTRPSEAFDTFIAVDSGELKRIGNEIVPRQPDIQIDHHVTNSRYA